MTRQELCEQLKSVKNKRQVKLGYSLPIAFQLGKKKIEAIENGLTDFNVSDMFLYLDMCNAGMELSHWDYYNISTLQELQETLKYERIESEYSIMALAKRSHVSSKIITAFEGKRCGLKIDTFLKLINSLEIQIEID